MQLAFAQHSRARRPLVREYPVGDTTEVRPNDDSSWSSTSSESPPIPPQESDITPRDIGATATEDSTPAGSNVKAD